MIEKLHFAATKHSDLKSKRPVAKSASVDKKDSEDGSSSTKSSTRTPVRKTPAQVKAESAAKKAKV